MRNLKKIFAVLLAVAMIASMMVPALAAVTYGDEGLKLQAIGLIAGGAEDLKLEDSLNRIQGLAFTIRAAGKEDDAFAMTDAEVDSILAEWKDAATIPAWGRKYAAYAAKNEITVGQSKTEKIFGAMDPISGTSFLVFLMRSGMGYSSVTTANVVDAAVTAGILTPGQAVTFGMKAALIRDDAAGILFGAAKNGKNADGTRLIDALIASGDVDAKKAADAGFAAPVVATLEAIKATATNLKEIVVAFNAELDADAAKDKANYSQEKGITSVRLNDDKKSVTIELTAAMSNQSDFKVTVKTGVKSVAGVALAEDKELSGSVFDVTIPVALSAEQAGPTAFKVKFSEPVVAEAADFKVDGGTYFISKVESADNGYTVKVTLYATLPNGEHKVAVSGVEDYVPYKCVDTTLTFVASKDEVAPAVAKVVSASPEKVELEMTEDVEFVTDEAAAKAGIYHTNSANKPATVVIDGKKVTLTFATANKLPNGTAYLTIAKELFKDAWGNKNAAVEDLALTVTVDKTKPTVKSIKAENDKQIVIEFSEDIKANEGKFTILDSTGKDVTKDYTISKTFAAAKVTLDFNKALSGSTYSVVIEGIKDLAGNEIDKVQPNVAVTDTTAPEVSKAEIYKEKNVIKVTFNEVMKSEDILNLANYKLGSKYLSDTKVKASLADNGKAVILDYAKEDVASYDAFTSIDIGRVRDAAGNYIASFLTTKTLVDMDAQGILIDKVEATGAKTIVVTLKDALASFDAKDFVIYKNSVITTSSAVSFANNADGVGVITFTLIDEMKTDLSDGPVVVKTIATPASKNSLDVKVAGSQTSTNAVDKVSATIKAEFSSADAILITFSEEMELNTIAKASFTVSGNTVKSISFYYDNSDPANVIYFAELTLKDAVADGAKVVVTQVIDFEDKEGNVSKGLEVKDVEYTAP